MDVELTLDAFEKHHLANTVQVVRTGEEALDYLLGRNGFSDRKQHPLPDLVLLDLKLPGLGGVDVLREIKAQEHLKRIPIIILTSSRDEGDRALSYDNGANSYLVKPVSFEGFLETVSTIHKYWVTLTGC
jgi:DNA-binding response OmpR family regulator